MKNKNNNIEIEKLLKEKMNELSESVDCFDRISTKVFPEKSNNFSENDCSVSDLENVTGKAKKISIVKWSAIAVAVVACVTAIPQTNIISDIAQNIGSNCTLKNYRDIIAEIDSETQNGDYNIADYPLDYYIENDVLVTPLFVCPFEDCGKENANVRLYIRQINGINTNQVYAVEYEGDFAEENIIAAAQSEYRFSDEDVETAKDLTSDGFENINYSTTVGLNFDTDSDGIFVDENDVPVSLASFKTFTIMKCDNGIIPVESTIIYGHETKSDDSYFYDIANISGYENIQITERENAWGVSVYFNNTTAMPEENQSIFSQELLFDSDLSYETECLCVACPDDSHNNEFSTTASIYAEDSKKQLCEIDVPYDLDYRSMTVFYIPQSAVENTDSVAIHLSDRPLYDYTANEIFTEIEYEGNYAELAEYGEYTTNKAAQ